jgi:UDP:flavonoid glycosyltransferase YjiC (YdhE family)
LSRVLFVTSNGTGLGHLTRGMAIARRFGDDLEPVFLTLSAAAPVVDRMGFAVEYFPSHIAAAAEAPRRWDRRLRARLELLVEELETSVLAFDGAHPYDALIALLRARRGTSMRSVWVRRPMWRAGFGAEAIYWSQEFDRVLEPGELAESEDRGLTVERRDEAERIAPIVFLDRSELLSRETACTELGLDQGRRHALVALGQGPELDAAVTRSLERLAADPEVQVAALESSLSPGLRVPEEVVHLRGTYPMSRYYRAFDLAVAAAGYNAFHELIAHGVPTLFVPMPRQIDDQPARARWAQESGVGRGVASPTDPALEDRLAELLDPAARDEFRANLAELPSADGAQQGARFIELLAREGGDGPRGGEALVGADSDVAGRRLPTPRSGGEPDRHVGGRPRLPAALSVSLELVRRVGLRLPLVVAGRARNRLLNPPPAPAKLVAVAFGLPADELIPRLRALARDEGIEAHRVLVITDSLEFTALRRAGFAFEYVPDRDRAARITGEPYESFAQRRIDAALAGRRAAQRVTVAAP